MHDGRLAGRVARFVAIAVLALVTACASPPKSKSKPTPEPAPSDALAPRAFFWEAQAVNGAHLFLLGSVHIGDRRQLVLDARIEQDWAQALELVVELDTSTPSPIDAVDAINRFGLLPRGTTLRSIVAPDTYQQLATYMKARGYPMERVDRMRPWLVAQVVTQLEYTAAGLEAENGVDVVMMRRASGRKGIVPLESLEEQAELFAGLPAPLQETMLVEILREAQALLAVTRATLTAWEQGDEKTLTELLFGNSTGDAALGQFYERVFYNRNRTMTDRIVALSADAKPRFVVVGTGHLIGPQGIPELLAQRGFRVERVGSARVLPGAATTPGAVIPAPAATPVEPSAPAPAPASAVAPILPPVPGAPVAPASTPASAPVPARVPAPEMVPATVPAIPAPEAPIATPAPVVQPVSPPSPTAPVRPSGVPQDSWLGQDAEQVPFPDEPAPAPVEPSPAPPEAAPAPAVTPAPAPPTEKPKPKTRRLSRPKP